MKGEPLPIAADEAKKEFKGALAGDLLARKFRISVTAERRLHDPLTRHEVNIHMVNREFGRPKDLKLTVHEACLLRDALLALELGHVDRWKD